MADRILRPKIWIAVAEVMWDVPVGKQDPLFGLRQPRKPFAQPERPRDESASKFGPPQCCQIRGPFMGHLEDKKRRDHPSYCPFPDERDLGKICAERKKEERVTD